MAHKKKPSSFLDTLFFLFPVVEQVSRPVLPVGESVTKIRSTHPKKNFRQDFIFLNTF